MTALGTLGPLGRLRTLDTLWWLRLRLRRDRMRLTVWILSLAALVWLSVPAVAASFGTLPEREALVRLAIRAPSVLMLRGNPQGADIAALVFFQLFTFLSVLFALMSIFLAVRHSRTEEESGRADLVGATPAARILPLLATALHGLSANAVMGAVVAFALLAAGLDVAGSVVTGLALVATGAAFLAVGLLGAQLMRTSRGADALGAVAVAAAYVLRAVGDSTGSINADGLSMTSAWPSWLSPIGWAQQTSGFTSNNLSPLALHLGFALLVFALVAVLQSSRDVGAGLVSERVGRDGAAPALRGSVALVWRLQWPAVVGWSLAGCVFGLLAGLLGETVLTLVRSNAGVLAALSSITEDQPSASAGSVSDGAVIDVFVAAMFSLVGVVAAAAATQTMIRMRQDEINRSAELLLSTPLTRIRWLLDYLLVGAVAGLSVTVAAVIGAAIGLTRSAATGERAWSVATAGVAQLPAVFLLLTISAALFAFVPRWSMGVSWAVLLVSLFVGQFGGLLGLSEAVRAVSPFSHTPEVAAAGTDWSGNGGMLALAAAVAALAVLGMRRRDLVP